MWRDAGLSWKDFLPEDEDVNKFVTEKVNELTATAMLWNYSYDSCIMLLKYMFNNLLYNLCVQGVEFTLGEECVRKSSKSSLSPEDITRELERLLQEKADNQRMFDWVEVCVCVWFKGCSGCSTTEAASVEITRVFQPLKRAK